MEDETQENENTSTSNIGTSSFDETDKKNIIEELYRCKSRVADFIKAIEGTTRQDALAGRKFLKKQYTAMTAVINTTNAFTKKQGDPLKLLLHRANKAFILDVVNEPTIHRRHYVTLVYSYWHMVELFLGLALNGHGANVLKDALAGLNTPEEKEPEKIGLVDELRRNKRI